MGVCLEQRDFDDFNRRMAHHPVGRLLPRVQLYDSPKEANGRFGGHFTVRIRERNDPDTGVRDRGLERELPEVGPQVYSVSANAERANAEVIVLERQHRDHARGQDNVGLAHGVSSPSLANAES
jgi:hypothetical protein